MAFAIKGGREGVSRAINVFFKNGLSKPFRIIPWLSKRVLHIVWALYYIHIVVDVTMNMARYTSSWHSAAGAAEECQYLNQLQEDFRIFWCLDEFGRLSGQRTAIWKEGRITTSFRDPEKKNNQLNSSKIVSIVSILPRGFRHFHGTGRGRIFGKTICKSF